MIFFVFPYILRNTLLRIAVVRRRARVLPPGTASTSLRYTDDRRVRSEIGPVLYEAGQVALYFNKSIREKQLTHLKTCQTKKLKGIN